MAGNHIDDGRRHEKRRNTAGAAGHELVTHVLDQRQTANARANQAANTVRRLFVQSVSGGQTCISHCLQTGRHTQMDEAVHGSRFFGGDVGVEVEVFHFTCKVAGER